MMFVNMSVYYSRQLTHPQIVDKYSFMTHREEDRRGGGGRMGGRRPGRMGSGFGYGGGFGMDAWDRFDRY
jgi:hypothetical protein